MGKPMFVYPKKGETFAIGCLFPVKTWRHYI